jgi:predicted NAD/FAD-dependent oxidoreductase
MTSSVVVVGAGIAGLSCARVLTGHGLDVRVLERGPVAGGRLASPMLDGRPVDLGAAYFTASDPGFGAVVRGWHERGLVRPWTAHFEVYGQSPHSPDTPAPERWAAPAGLGALAADLATGLPVRYGVEVRELGQFAGTPVVLAMPAPQAAGIHPPLAGVAAEQEWQPALAVALRYPARCWPDFAGAFVNDHPVLATVCDDGDRRGDRAPVLVAHTTADFAREDAVPAVEAAVRELLHLPLPADHVAVRRWPQARPARPYQTSFMQVGGVFLAGDGFGRPRVEAAWLSGRAAAEQVVATITATENSKSPRNREAPR